MLNQINIAHLLGWILGLVVLTIGILNLVLVHPVPGSVFTLLSLLYFPPVDVMIKNKLGISIPFLLKIILWVIIVWFTLGISDLADILGI